MPNNSLEEDMVVKGPGNKNQQPDFGRYHHSTQRSSEKIREKIEVLFTEALDDLPFSRDDEPKILDIGCGLGFLSWIYAKYYPNGMIRTRKPHIPIYLGGYSQSTFVRIANYANGWICVIRDSLDEARSNISKIRDECRKAKRDPKDIHIAAILYPNVIDSGNANKERHRIQSKQHLQDNA